MTVSRGLAMFSMLLGLLTGTPACGEKAEWVVLVEASLGQKDTIKQEMKPLEGLSSAHKAEVIAMLEAMAKIEPGATSFEAAYTIMVKGLETLPPPEPNNAVGGGLNLGATRRAAFRLGSLVLSGLVQKSEKVISGHSDHVAQQKVLAASIQAVIRPADQSHFKQHETPYFFDSFSAMQLFGTTLTTLPIGAK